MCHTNVGRTFKILWMALLSIIGCGIHAVSGLYVSRTSSAHNEFINNQGKLANCYWLYTYTPCPEKSVTLFSTINLAILDKFFCTTENRNEYSIKQVKRMSLQPYYFSTLPDKMKNSTKTVDRLLHYVEPVVPNFLRKSFSVRFSNFFLVCWTNFLAAFWQKIFYILTSFYKK